LGIASWKEIPLGGIILEPRTSLKYKTGSWRSSTPKIDYNKCIRCLFCWIYCPEPAITRDEENNVTIDLDYCKGCGICANVCPVKAITMEAL